MAKDLPEYEQHQAIQPATQVSDFESAFKGFSDSYNSLANIGAQFAQNAAIERATIEGVKAGQTPGRNLIPAFTDSDKAFVQAYKQEEYQTVARDAEVYMNKQFFEAAKNPDANSLALYEKNVQGYAQKVEGIVSEENRPKLKRDLQSFYESKFYQLAGAVETRNKKIMKENFTLNYESNNEKGREYYATGEPNKGRDNFQKNIDFVKQQLASGIIDEPEARASIKRAEEERALAIEEGTLQEHIQQGTGAKYLEQRAALPPTPQNQMINRALLQQYSQYNSLMHTQSHIAKQEGLEIAAQGTLPLSTYLDKKAHMTESDKADFDYGISKIALKNVSDSAGVDYVVKNKGNDAALALATPEVLNKAFQLEVSNRAKLNGKEPSFEDMAQAAKDFKVPIPNFTKQLGTMINSYDPENARRGSQVYAGLKSQYPRSVDGIDSKIGAKASLINSQLARNIDPHEAIKFANGKVDGLREEDIEHRKGSFDKLVKLDPKLNSFTAREEEITTLMGYGGEAAPSGMYTDFMKNFERAYTYLDDWDLAKQQAIEDTQRVYHQVSFNGFKQVMFMGGNILPFDNQTFNQNLIIRKAENVFKEQLKTADQFGYRYKFREGTLRPETNILYEGRQVGLSEKQARQQFAKKGIEITPEIEGGLQKDYSLPFEIQKGPLEVIRTDEDGKEIEGTLYLQTDSQTEFPKPGATPSAGMYFVQKGKSIPYPIYTNPGEIARFSVTERDIEMANSVRVKRQEAMLNRQIYLNSVNAQIRAMREKYGDTDELP